jgi:hypothetical protein
MTPVPRPETRRVFTNEPLPREAITKFRWAAVAAMAAGFLLQRVFIGRRGETLYAFAPAADEFFKRMKTLARELDAHAERALADARARQTHPNFRRQPRAAHQATS